MSKTFEVTGYTTKEEVVNALTQSILKNTFVLDINHPFPGYNRDKLEHLTVPRGILFVTSKEYEWNRILRTTKKISGFLEYNINGTYANVILGNHFYHAIRVKGIPSYEEIPIVQHAYQEEGFEFMKSKTEKGDLTAVIKVKKFYLLEEAEDGIFMDKINPDMYYILINRELNWELFRKMTQKIKNNISNRNFDVVLGAFYMDWGMKEMIRIYKPNCSLELLKEIKQFYQKEISKYYL